MTAATNCGMLVEVHPLIPGQIGDAVRLGIVRVPGRLTTAEPTQEVLKPPGSTIVTRTPNGATSWASDCDSPSRAHFEAW